LHWKPSEFDALPIREKAFVVAAIQIKMEHDRKEQKKAKKPSRRKRK